MNIRTKVLISVVAIASTLYAYEPSVYGAGDINSESPYGLTETEKAVLENKKNIQRLFNKINEQQQKIDGLTSIIEGQSKEALELKEQLEVLSNTVEANKNNSDNNETYSLLLQLSQMVDTINDNYVTREEVKKLLAGSRPSSVDNSNLGSPTTGSNSADISDVYRKGVHLFANRSYSASKEKFEEALASNYKPASSNYYLGEIAYYTHNYNDAIAYYKQSASLYDKASYMPVLYLHTAISLDKTGQKEQAKGFYKYVVDNYPNTRSASIARKRL